MNNLGLEAFLAIVRTLSISKAAEQLNLTQPTISKRLQVLENELGVSLIDRGQGSKFLRLTPAGQRFIDIAQRWSSLCLESEALKFSNSNISLAIGSLDSINTALFPPLFRMLSCHEPPINLKIITSHSPEMYDLVEKREVDVAFTLIERPHPNIRIDPCFSEPMVVLRINSPSLSKGKPIHPRELDATYEVYQSAGISYKIWHDQWWPAVQSRFRLDNFRLVLTFLTHEKHWSIVPLSVAEFARERGDFSYFPLLEAPPDRFVYKITHKYPQATSLEGLRLLDYYMKQCVTSKHS
jgi:DNA-binding transcriptional LysR family regulator